MDGRTFRILTIADMREAAQRRLPRVIFDFVDGAAEDELGKAHNTAALDAVRVTPNYLIDIGRRSQKTDLFGRPGTARSASRRPA